jgi:N-acetylmuramidase
MSPAAEAFIRTVLGRSWRDSLLQLNGLNMSEMLRALAALDPLDREDLWANRDAAAGAINLPRIEYARTVVIDRRLPTSVPGDLAATGQVTDAQSFLATPTPLVFENDLTDTLPAPLASPPRLGEMDFIAAAAGFAPPIEVAALAAVAQVEAGGRNGFQDGRPIIRFELHVFHRETRGIYARSHPHLSQPTLAAGRRYHRGGQANEWSMMYASMILRVPPVTRRIAEAFRSASWGMFQVMGFNAAAVGWPDPIQFGIDMATSEANQLRAFVGFIRSSRLEGALRRHDWTTFARAYNGAGFAVNQYDARIGAAYNRISVERRRRRMAP